MLKKIRPIETKAWKELENHYKEIKKISLRELFLKDKNRFEKFSIWFKNELLLDYSKNIITEKTLDLLVALAEECKLKDAIESYFKGELINETENRAVLHTALRNFSEKPVMVKGKDVMPEIRNVLAKMEKFCKKILNKEWIGYTGVPIDTIVNIGIGGSDLGPRMVTRALSPYAQGIDVYFVSNIDGTNISEVLKKVNPESTMFFISSKSFTTQETMENAKSARNWFLAHAREEKHIKKHFIAISTNKKAVEEFGIDSENMFVFWDFVGGRYSLWSAIGLSIACYIGYENFENLLYGAYEMDMHFRNTPFSKNIPVILALLGIWYNNFFNAQSYAILPYDEYLSKLPAYLQQADMESNGKSVDRAGKRVEWQTGPIIFGQPGTNGQHAFYQLIHQGTKLIPCDFLAEAITHNPRGSHHQILMANFFAQTEALMSGKTEEEVINEMKNSGKSEEEIRKLLPYRVFDGSKPTNTILFKKLTPRMLGRIIAMYEHKIFTQGVIWNIFSFDQWGVELGKQLARKILKELESENKVTSHDSSTNGLINAYKFLAGLINGDICKSKDEN